MRKDRKDPRRRPEALTPRQRKAAHATKRRKVCSKCKRRRLVKFFTPKARGKFGVRADCKACQHEATMDWRRRNPARHQANRQREYDRLRKHKQ